MNEDALFPARPVEVRADPKLQSMVLGCFRADIELDETYEHVPGEPLGCPVTVFAGTDERAATLFTVDGAGGLWTNDTGEPIVCRGHENHLIHSFEFENGKIKLQREFMSPSQRLRALGIDVPAVRCDRIPT